MPLTPIRAAHNSIVSHSPRRRIAGHTKICQFNGAILVRQNVGAFDIAMDDTLVVEVDEPVEDLGNVDGDEGFREFAEAL